MFYDEAIRVLRMDEATGLSVLRYITRSVPEWDGRWIEWRNGHIELRFDANLTCMRLSNVDTRVLTAEDLGARDWMVGEWDDEVDA